MKSIIIIFIGLYGSWHFIDLSSDNSFYAVICPILFTLFLITAAILLVTRGGFGGRTDDKDTGFSFSIHPLSALKLCHLTLPS